MENGKVGTGASGRVSVRVMGAPWGAGWVAARAGARAAVDVSGSDDRLGVIGGGVLAGCQAGGRDGPFGVQGEQPFQRGGDGVAGREGVAADDVDDHELGPAAVAPDPGVAGTAGGAQLADVGFE